MEKEKKEIWKMEKEIELNIKLHNLFKEYIENYGGDAKSTDSLDYVVIDDWQAFLYWQRRYLYETLISKKFGMVKWLVENDKISNDWIKPRTDLVKEITIVDYKTGDAIWWKNKYTEVEQLIMYLSIQDEPIRFLCEIIK